MFLFLLNLTMANSATVLQVLMGKEITVVHPFCKKKSGNSHQKSQFNTDKLMADSVSISAVCTTVFSFREAHFIFIPGSDNFKDFVFAEPFHINLFTERFYIPPRA